MMTNAERKQAYQAIEEKVLRSLEEKSGEQLVCDETLLALRIISNVTEAQWLLEEQGERSSECEATADEVGNTVSETIGKTEEVPFHMLAPKSDSESEPEPKAEHENEVEPEAEREDGPSMTKEEVRAKLARLPDQLRVKVAGIMAEMGYGKLSEVPTSRYQELLDKASAMQEA